MINKLISYLIITLIKFYQFFISPLLGSSCRFQPTCSKYAIIAIEELGVFHGLSVSIKRLLKCHPFGGQGFDPVNKKIKK